MKFKFKTISILTATILGLLVLGKNVQAGLYPDQAALDAAYREAASQGRADEFLKNASQHGSGEEYQRVYELWDRDRSDGNLDGKIPEPGQGGADQPKEPIKVYDMSGYDIETDADGNITGFKKKKKEGEEEGEEGEEGEDQGQQQGQGGKKPPPPPPPPDPGKEVPGDKDLDFSRWCWFCVEGPKCQKGVLGGCDLKPCTDEQICHEHKETLADGRQILCHECQDKTRTPPPPPVCEEKGFISDPACNGKCPPEMCHKVLIGPDGKIRTWTAVRGDLECYECLKKSSCQDRNMSDSPDCGGACTPDMCEAVYIDSKGAIVPPGRTVTRQDLKCYRCRNSQTQPPPECTRGVTDPKCFGMCEQKDCEVVQTVVFGDQHWYCYDCKPKPPPSACEEKGYFDDPGCSNFCEEGSICIPVRIAPDGAIRGTNQTQSKQDLSCYACMRITEIEITWIIIIIETPFERFVLEKGKQDGFKPTSVMVLAKMDQATGMIKNTMGELKPILDFMGGFNVGWGPMGLTTTGKISMTQLSNLLSSKLSSSGSFGAGCFEDALKEADSQAFNEGIPTSDDIRGTGNERKSDKKKGESEVFSEEQLKKAQEAGNPAISGPIIACGNEGRNKVLRIYDANGAFVDSITQAVLKSNPNIITEKLGLAQQLTDMFIQKSGIDFASYIEKFTGLPLKDMQSYAAKVAEIKAQLDQVVDKKASKKKKKKEEEKKIIIPNDPLFLEDAGKPKSAVRERMKQIAANPLGGGMRIKGVMMGESTDTEENRALDRLDVKDQWGIRKVGFTDESDPNSAWNVVDAVQKNVVVAVIDSGLDMAHPDSPQYIWTNPKETPGNGVDDDKNGFVDDIHGWNFLNENHDFTDIRGHGTFVAGIIAAKYNNGEGIAGINPGAVIMPIKVADEEGVTNSLSIYRGINYAVNHGAKVINVSLGSRSISKLEQQAIERANAMGALVVVASGNNNNNLMEFGPASSKYSLAVGQIDFSGVRSTVSNWGPNLSLVAPGEQIYSLCSKDNKHVLPSIRKTGYYKQDGTSFSTPMVTATASLLWAKNPNLTNQQVADIILATATDMDEKGWDGMTGYGLLNAASALRADVDEKLILMFTTLRINRDINDRVISVDVFGTVRGKFKEFTIEVGKGKNPGGFKTVAGPFQDDHNYQHIVRLNVHQYLRGSADWVFRIKAIDKDGKEHFASTPFTLPK